MSFLSSMESSLCESHDEEEEEVVEVMDGSWLISVKTVGAEHCPGEDPNARAIPSLFQVQVKPNDDIQSLHDRIESVTGLTPNQQRLIYRGRLIQSSSSSSSGGVVSSTSPGKKNDTTTAGKEENSTGIPTKISEIKGLGDGHTIHLVRRNESAEQQKSPSQDDITNNRRSTTTTPPPTSSSAGNSTNNNNNDNTVQFDSAGTATGSLLAALFGLSALDEEPDESPTSRGGWRRYTSSSGRNRNRNNFRLTPEDLQINDPGSMESVRQGLLTLHTLLPPAQQHIQPENNHPSSFSPLDSSRRWYLGQWIDCRDTVNQWLEATIVAIVRPDDILPHGSPPPRLCASPTIHPAMDSPVGASDFEGRRRLLLEPCEQGDPHDLGGELAGFRRRCSSNTNDDSLLLLLIHYNGWPHRWDEWIRSDSERIRPFRTRTRHNTSFIAPTIQSPLADSPTTFIRGRSDGEDRLFLLNELVRVSSAINTLAQHAASALPRPSATGQGLPNDLPWTDSDTPPPTAESQHFTNVREQTDERDATSWDGGIDTANDCELPQPPHANNDNARRHLEMLAPLLDRLGRTLVDAAPHLAFLAADASSPLRTISECPQEQENQDDGVLSESGDNSHRPTSPNSLGGLLALLNRDRPRNSRTPTHHATTTQVSHGDGTSTTVDVDYVDFATGLVNVSRGDVRSGPRGRSSRGNSDRDELGGLLGAYLAATSLGGLGNLASAGGGTGGANNGNNENGDGNGTGNEMQGLGRLLRGGETGGGGIDIHIHAVVTTPGGAAGLALAGLGPPVSPPDLFASTRRATAQRVRATLLEQVNQEDSGIFDDLYSENPGPVSPDPQTEESRPSLSSPLRRSTRRSHTSSMLNSNNNSNRTSFLGRLFRRNGSSAE